MEQCVICKEETGTIKHHIIPRRIYPASEGNEEIIQVCKHCHGFLHSWYIETAFIQSLHKDKKFFHEVIENFKWSILHSRNK